MKTQGEIESAVSEGMSRFEQDYMGRGPKHINAHLIDDVLIVRLDPGASRSPISSMTALFRTGWRCIFMQADRPLISSSRGGQISQEGGSACSPLAIDADRGNSAWACSPCVGEPWGRGRDAASQGLQLGVFAAWQSETMLG